MQSSGDADSIRVLVAGCREQVDQFCPSEYRKSYRSSATDQDRQPHTLRPAILARLFLAGGTVKRAAITDRNPLDDRPAASAFFALAIVNAQVALKFAALVIGGAVI